MGKENLIFSSKTHKLEILIETCLISEHHYGPFWTHLSIYVFHSLFYGLKLQLIYLLTVLLSLPINNLVLKEEWEGVDQ